MPSVIKRTFDKPGQHIASVPISAQPVAFTVDMLGAFMLLLKIPNVWSRTKEIAVYIVETGEQVPSGAEYVYSCVFVEGEEYHCFVQCD